MTADGTLEHDGGVPKRLILWDIDGTLLTTGPVGRMALEEGARLVAGLDVVPTVDMSGKTDPQIIAEILVESGKDSAEADDLLAAALAEAERLLSEERGLIASSGRLHKGVAELLRSLSEIPGVRQTLLSGNVAANARVKVSAFGLDGYFDFAIGAYGDDNPDRDCLVPIAIERADRLRGLSYLPDEVWVIGDTEKDLSCARAGGVRCLIVGTGHRGFAAVRHLGADFLMEDLGDTELAMKVLLGQ
jgi:phosphoglycolate phosphatase-like HAD superfamily hydrolase